MVVELGGLLKSVRFWRSLSGNVTIGFPFKIGLVSGKVGGAGDSVAFDASVKLGVNFAFPEGAIPACHRRVCQAGEEEQAKS